MNISVFVVVVTMFNIPTWTRQSCLISLGCLTLRSGDPSGLETPLCALLSVQMGSASWQDICRKI